MYSFTLSTNISKLAFKERIKFKGKKKLLNVLKAVKLAKFKEYTSTPKLDIIIISFCVNCCCDNTHQMRDGKILRKWISFSTVAIF